MQEKWEQMVRLSESLIEDFNGFAEDQAIVYAAKEISFLLEEVERLKESNAQKNSDISDWVSRYAEQASKLHAANLNINLLRAVLKEIEDMEGTERDEWDAVERIIPEIYAIAKKSSQSPPPNMSETEAIVMDAERLRHLVDSIDITPYIKEYHSGRCLSIEELDSDIQIAESKGNKLDLQELFDKFIAANLGVSHEFDEWLELAFTTGFMSAQGSNCNPELLDSNEFLRTRNEELREEVESLKGQLSGSSGWIPNAEYLLSRCAHTIRSDYKMTGENTLESLILTFTAMESKIKELQKKR